GFKYFDFKGVKGIELDVCGYGKGDFEVRTTPDGPVYAKLGVDFETVWVTYKAECNIPDGVSALYLKYTGFGNMGLKSFRFLH
ncbi:MAG: alpha-N-arabinofuranosidase, partial [Lachnospiraceae bacterium]|nr:alpha-N-arabinofuranosidase [Lachnospiraceae bacterium]